MKKIIILSLFLFSVNVNSQTKEKVSVFLENNPYFKNYNEELFFLHTNKTLYFSGEDIWFAAYVINKLNEKPSEVTKNLHVNLYNSDFKLINQKLYHVNEGKASGQFKLLENLASGNYYIELDTNLNRNFKKGTINKIEVVNLKSPAEKTTTQTENPILEKESQNVLKSRKYEISINRNLKEYNSTNFKFNINKVLYKKYKRKTLFAVLHKNNIISSCASIEVSNKKNSTIKFDSEFLFNGANTITLFDINNTIVAKKQFWNFNSKIGVLEITKNKETKDSLYLNLKLPNNNSKSSLSISILNAESALIFNDSNILNAFLDTDYTEIKKHHKNNKLDEFLNNRIVNLFPLKQNNISIYKNETGVKIKGKVNSKIKDLENYKIMLSSKENGLFLVNDIHADTSFEFDSLHIKHPSTYKLSLVNKKAKTKRGDFYIYSNYYRYKPDSLLNGIISSTPKKLKENNFSKPKRLISTKDVIELEEVKIITFADKEKEIRNKYRNIIGHSFTDFYIPDDNLALGTDIFEYLWGIPGLKVVYVPLTNTPLVFNTRGPKSFRSSQLVNVKLNGIPLGEDLGPLVGMLTIDFEVIVVNLSGAGEGIRGSNGVVNLIQKSGDDYKRRKIIKATEIQTITGFEKSAAKYVNSNLEFNDINSLKAYSVIDWIPDFKLESNTSALLKIPLSKNLRNMKLIINGFDNDGKLIHKTIIINDDFK
jgi:hypothetical protein